MKLSAEDLDDLALGSVFLATGGGGDPHVPKLLTREVLKQSGPVDLLAINDLADDAFVAAIGNVGAPTVSLELLPSEDEALIALEAFEKQMGRKLDAVVSFEIGGGNSLIPIMAAASRGIPVIDGDGMGRALPEAQMMTYAICGIPSTPALACDYASNVTLFTTKGTDVYERHIRALAMSSGGMITTVEHGMSGATLREALIPGTVSFALKLGTFLRENRGPAHDLIAPLKILFADSIYGDCRLIHTGKVVDKSTRIVGGFDVGNVVVEAFDEDIAPVEIDIKNEYLLARREAQVLASVPDLIVIVDYETSEPINAERLRYGMRIAIFAIGCPDFYRTDAALNVVSPRNFGFDLDYVPLEDLA
ncbi:MAG: DUF917 domain-containing protein [Pseudomonadota bacterium]